MRDRIGDAKVTQLEVFDHGGPVRRQAATAGEIAKVWGLHDVQIGDRLGGADEIRRGSSSRRRRSRRLSSRSIRRRGTASGSHSSNSPSRTR